MCMYPCIYICMHICIYTHICIIIYFLISRPTYIILGISPRVVVYPSLMLSSCHFLRLLVNRGHPDYPQSPVHVGEHLLSTYYTYSLDLPSSVLFFRHTWPQTFVLRLSIVPFSLDTSTIYFYFPEILPSVYRTVQMQTQFLQLWEPWDSISFDYPVPLFCLESENFSLTSLSAAQSQIPS